MLLTDEEIWAVDKTIPDKPRGEDDAWYAERYYLKAQLKKVVEWLIADPAMRSAGLYSSNLIYAIDGGKIKALLKEVE